MRSDQKGNFGAVKCEKERFFRGGEKGVVAAVDGSVSGSVHVAIGECGRLVVVGDGSFGSNTSGGGETVYFQWNVLCCWVGSIFDVGGSISFLVSPFGSLSAWVGAMVSVATARRRLISVAR